MSYISQISLLCNKVFHDDAAFKTHMTGKHELKEDCSACYGCEDSVNVDFNLGHFEIINKHLKFHAIYAM